MEWGATGGRTLWVDEPLVVSFSDRSLKQLEESRSLKVDVKVFSSSVPSMRPSTVNFEKKVDYRNGNYRMEDSRWRIRR